MSDMNWVLESFDQADERLRRQIVLELLEQLREAQQLVDSLADRVAKQAELLRKRAEK